MKENSLAEQEGLVKIISPCLFDKKSFSNLRLKPRDFINQAHSHFANDTSVKVV
jgi:hypothetical protein